MVLVDHEMGRQVGTVREVVTAPDVTGGVVLDWYFASVDLDETPEWLKRNCGVSWAHKTLQEQDVNGTRRILRALITEVSVLSPGVEPAEPCARVSWVGEKPASSSAAGSTTSDRTSSPARSPDALDDYGFRDADELEAFLAKTNRAPLDRLYDEVMAAKAAAARTSDPPASGEVIYHPGQVVRRHNTGHVIGVR